MTNFPTPLMRRRRLLTAAAGLAAAGGALGTRLLGSGGVPTTMRLRELSPREAATAARLAPAILPEDTPFPNWEIAGYLDNYVAALGHTEQTMLHGFLFALDQGTLLDGFWTPAHRMTREAAVRAVRAWENSRLGARRDMAKGFRQLVGFAWLAQPDTRQRYGIARTCGSGTTSFLPETHA